MNYNSAFNEKPDPNRITKPGKYHLENISEEDFQLCQNFAEEVVITNPYYSERGQFDKDNIIQQHTVSKIAELGVYLWLEKHGCNYPDFNIYPPGKKSWNPDLKCLGCNLHVKSQIREVSERYGLSWTFQYADSQGKKSGRHRDNILNIESNNTTDYVILTQIDNLKVYICGTPLISNLLTYPNIFSLPEKVELQKSKRIIHYRNLEKLPKQEKWAFNFLGIQAANLNT